MRALIVSLALLISGTAAFAEVAMFSQRNFQGARYALETESANMRFSPRSVRVLEGEAWQFCPRPFFGGTCLTIDQSNPKLSLPRGFSGEVRSARKIAQGGSSPDGSPVGRAESTDAQALKPMEKGAKAPADTADPK